MKNLNTKYRPQRFSEVIGQESNVQILKQQLETDNICHAMLFTGVSGTGKTTIARIFANALNYGSGTPIEIDAASNSGVDNMRSVVATAGERSLDSTYKVIIIDEVQSLSSAAWQSLLKCIEEPPKYTVFIFCTTEPQKVPRTIINRCMRFNFNRLKPEVINQRLQYICSNEGLIDYEDGCEYISKICNGEMRQGIALLEKCANYSKEISVENVLVALGNYSYENFCELTDALIDADYNSVIKIVNSVYESGMDFKLFVEQFIEFLLDINHYLITKNMSCTKLPSNIENKVKSLINLDNAEKYYMYLINELLNLKIMKLWQINNQH